MKNVLKVATLAVLGCAFIGGETQGMWDKLQASVAKNPRKVNQYRAKRGLAPLDPAQIRAAAKPTGGQRFGGTVNSKNSVLNDQSSSDEEEVVLSTENLDEELEGQQSQLTPEESVEDLLAALGDVDEGDIFCHYLDDVEQGGDVETLLTDNDSARLKELVPVMAELWNRYGGVVDVFPELLGSTNSFVSFLSGKDEAMSQEVKNVIKWLADKVAQFNKNQS